MNDHTMESEGAVLAVFNATRTRRLAGAGRGVLLSWLYALFGARGGARAIGVIEISAAVLIALRRWRPDLSALGSLLAAATFIVTLSFLATTPGVLAPTNPFGGFLMKDVILLGTALYTAAEALDAAEVKRQWTRRPTR